MKEQLSPFVLFIFLSGIFGVLAVAYLFHVVKPSDMTKFSAGETIFVLLLFFSSWLELIIGGLSLLIWTIR